MAVAYLAGPISGRSYGGCTTWRDRVSDHLARYGIRAASPMRSKGYLADEDVIEGSYPAHVLSCDRGIMTRDHLDCARCDVVIANLLGATRVSVGTVMEIAWAHAYRKPLVLVIEPDGNPHDHPMVREAAGFRVDNLVDAVRVARAVLEPYLPGSVPQEG